MPRQVNGKWVRVFLFARKSPLSRHPVLWQVEGFDVDHALSRLVEVEHWIPRAEWTLCDQWDPEESYTVGKMGRQLPLHEDSKKPLASLVSRLFTPNKTLH